MEKVIIGIDLGGTNLRIGAVTADNEIYRPQIIRSAGIAQAEDPVQELCQIIWNYIEENQIENLEAISIGVPSSVENDKETVICTTNIRNKYGKPVFEHRNIAKDIREEFHVPAFVNNDINNILLYDVAANHLENQKVVIGIYIGTGVGASVLIDGKLLEGKNGAELDIGHLPIYGQTAACSCGKEGCVECFASGWKLQDIRRQYYPETRIDDIFTLYKYDGPVREFVKACANIFAVMATIFNPDTMIAGGGVIEMADFPKEEFEREVAKATGKDVMEYGFDYAYSKAFYGKGVIGAAIFARGRIEKRK